MGAIRNKYATTNKSVNQKNWLRKEASSYNEYKSFKFIYPLKNDISKENISSKKSLRIFRKNIELMEYRNKSFVSSVLKYFDLMFN